MAAVALILLGLAAPGGAGPPAPITADAALASYRRTFAPVAEIDCPKASGPDEIIVCGRPGAADPNRLPLPIPRLPGEIVPGEGVSPVAVASTRERCTTVGPNQNCGGGLPVLGIAMAVAKVAIELIKSDD
jgi:hypothetical protein